MAKIAKVHIRDHNPGPNWKTIPYQGPPKALCGSKLELTNNAGEATCATCLELYRVKRVDTFNFLRQAILKQIITREEYENFWDEVLVSQVMDA